MQVKPLVNYDTIWNFWNTWAVFDALIYKCEFFAEFSEGLKIRRLSEPEVPVFIVIICEAIANFLNNLIEFKIYYFKNRKVQLRDFNLECFEHFEKSFI